MTGVVFILSTDADRKLVNRVLLYLRDWQYGEAPSWDVFHIVRTHDPLNTELQPDIPPLRHFINEWAGKSILDTEGYMREQKQAGSAGPQIATRIIYLVLDDRGIEEETIILSVRSHRYTKQTGIVWLDTFRKVRVPWKHAYISWCNLDIANMDFEAFIDEWKGVDDNGWCTFKPFTSHPDSAVDARLDQADAEEHRMRSAAIEELERTGDA